MISSAERREGRWTQGLLSTPSLGRLCVLLAAALGNLYPSVSALPCPAPSLKACFRDHGTCDVELSSIKFLKQPVQLTESRAQDATGRGEWRSRRARRLRRLRLAYGTGEQGGSLGSGWGIEDSSPESQLASPPPSPQASYLYRWSLSPEAPEDSPVPVYREMDTCVG